MEKIKKTLLFLLLITLSVGLSAAILYFAFTTKDEIHCLGATKLENDVCVTTACTLTAAAFLETMDLTVDPCHDFYRFSCANFIKKNPVLEGKESITTESLFNTQLNFQIKELMESNIRDLPAVVKKFQELYHVCLNASNKPDKEFEALKNFSIDILQWPLSIGDEWNPKFQTISDLLINIERMGYSNKLFTLDISLNKSETNYVITITPGSLITFFDEDDIEDNKDIQDKELYLKIQNSEIETMVLLAQHFGNLFSLDKELRNMKMISKYEATMHLKQPDADGKMSIGELTQLSSGIDWLKLLNSRASFAGITFKNETEVNIKNLTQLKTISRIIQEFPLRMLNNILAWKIIFPDMISLGGSIGFELIEEYKMNFPNYKPSIQHSSKHSFCLSNFQTFYPLVLARMFVDKYIDKNNKKEATEMIELIQNAYTEFIKQSDFWLDNSSKTEAIEKITSMKKYIGYPDFIFNNEELEIEYAMMPSIHSTHFFNWFSHLEIYQRLRLIKPENQTWQKIDPLAFHAIYSNEDNTLFYLSSLLQLPYFDSTRPASVNFATMGTIIAHKIINGFFNSGHPFNLDFDEKIKCFIQQYIEFCPDKQKRNEFSQCVPDKKTLADIVANFIEIQVAFSAYETWIEKYGMKETLPGLQQFTPEHLFFISYTYNRCVSLTPDKWKQNYGQEKYSLIVHRILTILSNNKNFKELFQCHEDQMNRSNHNCTI